MLKEIPDQQFIVRSGNLTSQPFATMRLAEAYILTLTPEQQAQAMVVPVISGTNQQILLG